MWLRYQTLSKMPAGALGIIVNSTVSPGGMSSLRPPGEGPPVPGATTRGAILHTLCRHRNLSRIDIAQRLNLNISTISIAVKELIQEGILCECGVIKAVRGRPKTRLAIAEDVVVCGVDVSESGVTAGVVDLSGRILALDRTYYSSSLAHLPSFLDRILRRLALDPHVARVEGVGVTLAEDLLPTIESLGTEPLALRAAALREKLKESVGLHVEVESEMHSMVLGESLFGALSGVQNAVLVHVSDTIRATIVSNGKLHAGTADWASQIAHLIVDPNGARCSCGQRGCLDAIASSRAVLDSYRKAGASNSASLTIQDFLDRVEDQDPVALQILRVQVEALASSLRALVLVAAPQVILLAGPIVKIWREVEPVLQRAMLAVCGPNGVAAVRRSTNPEQMRLLGAAATVLSRNDRYRSYS